MLNFAEQLSELGWQPNFSPEEAERWAVDGRVSAVARQCRVELVAAIDQHLGPFPPMHLRAVLEVPRERFVRATDLARSNDDAPLPLDDTGLATISAPHAYLLSFRLLGLLPGDQLLELGTGYGYGAALGSDIVGPRGGVTTIEIDRDLAACAAARLAHYDNIRVVHGDAMANLSFWREATSVVCTFAVETIPPAWLSALPEGARLAAPVGPRDREQRLVCVARRRGELEMTDHGAVRYVSNRSPAAPAR